MGDEWQCCISHPHVLRAGSPTTPTMCKTQSPEYCIGRRGGPAFLSCRQSQFTQPLDISMSPTWQLRTEILARPLEVIPAAAESWNQVWFGVASLATHIRLLFTMLSSLVLPFFIVFTSFFSSFSSISPLAPLSGTQGLRVSGVTSRVFSGVLRSAQALRYWAWSAHTPPSQACPMSWRPSSVSSLSGIHGQSGGSLRPYVRVVCLWLTLAWGLGVFPWLM